MNKKGFTLAELLGVIVLLGIIAIIAISTTGTNLEEGRQKACLAQEKNILEAMKTYMIDNPNELPTDENQEKIIEVEFLRTHGYLAEDFTNPSTDKKYDAETKAVVMLRGSNYIYRVRYKENDGCNSESSKKDEIEDNVKINQPSVTSTKDSITVTANASANDGIESYEFSINGGTTWQNNGSNNIYTFTGLEDDKEYTILVRTTTKNGYIDVKRKSAETKIADAIISPQASSGSNTTVNLTYPIGCTNGKYTCTYTKDSEAPVSVGETTTSVNFIGSGTIATEVKSNRNSANKLTNSQNITIEYTASFLKGSNVSSVGKSSEACTVTSGNTTCEVTLPSITANTGHLSVGWSTTNGATTGTAAGQKVSISKNTTYYANAKVNTYTIAYTLNSGTHGSSHPTSATFNTAFTLNNPTRSGYTFSGWSISGMDSTTHYFGNTTSTATSSSGRKETSYKNLRASAGTVTFAAAWTQNKVTITSSKDRNTTDGYKSCRGNWYENRYNYTINYNGSSIQSGKMCYSDSNGGSTAKGCRNYSDGTGSAGGYGDACFNSATSWKYHRSNYCTYAYAKATNGASASKYQC